MRSETTDIAVRIRGLGFEYRGPDRAVIDNLDLDVGRGTVHAIVGPNGCGKSTLLRLVAGLEDPCRGNIDFPGRRTHPNRTALVFQGPRLIPWWEVGRNVAIGAEFSGKPANLYRRIRHFHTRQVGLGEVESRAPNTLSLGQQSMAGLGRGLAHDADTLLLDEPFTHLDALTRHRFYQEFETHWQLDPRTVVFVTHDVSEAVTLADRVSVMPGRPGPLIDTVDVDVSRPRMLVSPTDAGIRAATALIWDALERAG